MSGERDEQQDASPAGEAVTESPSPSPTTSALPAPATPAPAAPAPAAPAPAAPKASIAANLACLAVVPLAVLAGVVALFVRPHEHVRGEDLAAGACLFSVLGVGAALFARVAHRRASEWAALAVASFPWVVWSIAADLRPPRPLIDETDRAVLYWSFAEKLIEYSNVTTSPAALMLAALALAFALLAKAPRDESRTQLSRAFLVASVLPGAFLALAIAVTAHLSGAAVLTVLLSVLALDRVARNVELSSPRSLALGWAAALAAGAAVAATTTGAASHGLSNALDLLRQTMEPARLTSIVRVIHTLELSQLSPLFAVLPCIALLFAIDAETRGRGWSHVPRVALAVSTLVALPALWLDGRNMLDARRQIESYLRASGATDLIAEAPALDALPRLTHGYDLDGESFVLVSARGEARYRGAKLRGGLSGVVALAERDTVPPVLLDAHATASTALAMVAQATAAGVGEVRFMSRAESGSGLATVAWGPRFAPTPRYRDAHIILYLLVSPTTCVLGSTAGDRTEIPGCDGLEDKLDERHRMEPDRTEIVLAPDPGLELPVLLHMLDVLGEHGYYRRYAAVTGASF
jgi:hypothetical protein